MVIAVNVGALPEILIKKRAIRIHGILFLIAFRHKSPLEMKSVDSCRDRAYLYASHKSMPRPYVVNFLIGDNNLFL